MFYAVARTDKASQKLASSIRFLIPPIDNSMKHGEKMVTAGYWYWHWYSTAAAMPVQIVDRVDAC